METTSVETERVETGSADAEVDDAAEVDVEAVCRRVRPVLKKLANKYACGPPSSPMCAEELESVGMEAVLRALLSYDGRSSAAAYAGQHAKWAIIDWVRRFDPLTRYGRREYARIREARRARRQQGRPDSDVLVAEDVDLPVERVRRREREARRRMPASLEAPLHENDERTLIDLLELPDPVGGGEEVDRNILWRAVDALPRRERTIVLRCMVGEMSQRALARRWKLTESRVSQLAQNARRLLVRYLTDCKP